ncbi:MAG: hypothetical protein D3920_00010 [Candidatus Electrothrix sp. AW2]|nr:hypothetical protein [Candidatus Electrothrix gigas]
MKLFKMVNNKIHSILEIKEQKMKRIRLVSRNKMPYNFLYCKKNEKYIPWHIYCFQSFDMNVPYKRTKWLVYFVVSSQQEGSTRRDKNYSIYFSSQHPAQRKIKK